MYIYTTETIHQIFLLNDLLQSYRANYFIVHAWFLKQASETKPDLALWSLNFLFQNPKESFQDIQTAAPVRFFLKTSFF
jgi:hypothetical protein